MEFEKCQQTTPTTYSEVHYGNREVSTPLGMDFAVSANATVGLVLILTRDCYHFYFFNFERLEKLPLERGKATFIFCEMLSLLCACLEKCFWILTVFRISPEWGWFLVQHAWYLGSACMPLVTLPPLFNSCYHYWNYADIQLPFRTLLLQSKDIFPSSNFWYNVQHALWALGSSFSVWHLRGKGFFYNMRTCSCCLGCVPLYYGGWLSPVVLDWENWKNI